MTDPLINGPDIWSGLLPRPSVNDHKYNRGHAVILGSEVFTGATRLAAEACSRIGAGLVTVLAEHQAQLYRTCLPPDIMVTEAGLDAPTRPTVLLAGPGGCNESKASEVFEHGASLDCVFDADAIRLAAELSPPTMILTPHEGEFERYIGPVSPDRRSAAIIAARSLKATIVLKGPQTVIASPDGRCAENHTASPYLAKAGTGDVLAGMIAGLLAQGMPAFEAACAGVWLHGRAAERIGPGLLPQDIIAELRPLLGQLLA